MFVFLFTVLLSSHIKIYHASSLCPVIEDHPACPPVVLYRSTQLLWGFLMELANQRCLYRFPQLS